MIFLQNVKVAADQGVRTSARAIRVVTVAVFMWMICVSLPARPRELMSWMKNTLVVS